MEETNIISVKQKKKRFSWEKLIIWPLYTLIFLTPLFFLPWGVYAVSFNKQFLALFLILLSLFGYLGKSLNEGKIAYRAGNKLFFAFLVFIFLSLFLVNSKIPALLGFNGGETDSFINILAGLILFFLVSSNLKIEEGKTLLRFYLASITLLLIFQFLQFFQIYILPFDFAKTPDFNPIGTYLSLAVFLAANLILVLSILFSAVSGRTTKLLLSLLATGLFIFLLLANYSLVWMLLALSLVFILLLKLVTEGVRTKGMNALIVFVTLAIFLSFTPLVRLIDTNVSSEVSVSLLQNIDIVKNSWFSEIKSLAGIKDFVFGAGPSNFGYQYLKYRPVELNYENFFGLFSVRFDSGYSMILTYLVTFGLLGTILFLFFIFDDFIRSLVRLVKENKIHSLPILSFCFYLIAAGFIYNISYVMFLALFISLGFLRITSGALSEINLILTPQRTFILSLIIIILMVGSLLGIYFNSARLVASLYYSSGVSTFNRGDVDASVVKMFNAVSWDNRNDFYFRGLSQAFLGKLNAILNQPVPDKEVFSAEFRDILNNAINSAQAAVNLNRLESLNFSNLAEIYGSVLVFVPDAGRLALTNYNQAIVFDPKNPELYLKIAGVYLSLADKIQSDINGLNPGTKSAQGAVLDNQRKKELDQAKEAIDKSLSLKPNYSPAHFMLAQIFERDGKLKEAIEKANQAKIFSPNDSGVVFQLGLLYYKDNQLELAKGEFEKAVSLFDNYSNARYFLGLTYDRLGIKNKALEQFEKVLELNPGNLDIKTIINNIKSDRSALSIGQEKLPTNK